MLAQRNKGEHAMLRNTAAAIALLSLCATTVARAEAVDIKGFHAKVKAELADLGHLAELNGKYRIRVTEVTMDPGGYMHAHHHLGPGLRCIQSGEMKYEIGGKTTTYKAGDCFAETGATTHESSNEGSAPVVLLNFELLPADMPEGKGSIIPVPPAGAGHDHKPH
jgi:quercetin dioxygenase-like cupin family protein